MMSPCLPTSMSALGIIPIGSILEMTDGMTANHVCRYLLRICVYGNESHLFRAI